MVKIFVVIRWILFHRRPSVVCITEQHVSCCYFAVDHNDYIVYGGWFFTLHIFNVVYGQQQWNVLTPDNNGTVFCGRWFTRQYKQLLATPPKKNIKLTYEFRISLNVQFPHNHDDKTRMQMVCSENVTFWCVIFMNETLKTDDFQPKRQRYYSYFKSDKLYHVLRKRCCSRWTSIRVDTNKK